jgi:hypothetical protein
MQAILEVEGALILDDVREEVAIKRGVLGEQLVQSQLALGGDQVGEPDGARRNLRPLLECRVVIGVRSSVPYRFEDHDGTPPSVAEPYLTSPPAMMHHIVHRAMPPTQ